MTDKELDALKRQDPLTKDEREQYNILCEKLSKLIDKDILTEEEESNLLTISEKVEKYDEIIMEFFYKYELKKDFFYLVSDYVDQDISDLKKYQYEGWMPDDEHGMIGFFKSEESTREFLCDDDGKYFWADSDEYFYYIMLEESLRCSICFEEIELNPNIKDLKFQGHNAEPINNGRCCLECNKIVARARMKKTEVDGL